MKPKAKKCKEKDAWTLWVEGEFERCIPLFNEMLAEEPDSPDVHEAISVAYYMLGNEWNYMKHKKIAVKLSVDFERQEAQIIAQVVKFGKLVSK